MNKKGAFIGLMLLIAIDVFGCKCSVSTVPENFMRAEIVIRANIQKVYPNSSPENHYLWFQCKS
jgi:hypothetical protein